MCPWCLAACPWHAARRPGDDLRADTGASQLLDEPDGFPAREPVPEDRPPLEPPREPDELELFDPPPRLDAYVERKIPIRTRKPPCRT